MARACVTSASLALIAGALTTACSPQNDTTAPAPAAAAPAVAEPAAALPLPSPPLGRAEIVAAAQAAAAAYAAGVPPPKTVGEIADRRFVLRLPFGCTGQAPDAEGVRYAYAPETSALRLTARPEVWSEAPWVTALLGGEEAEAVEGFWIRRPWLLAETCPAWTAAARAGEAPPLVRSAETLGLAQVFESGGSRLLRRGARGYQATVKTDPDRVTPNGFRLVLEGRIRPGSERPVRCSSGSPDQRPACLILVAFDRVAFETPDGEMLAEWRS